MITNIFDIRNFAMVCFYFHTNQLDSLIQSKCYISVHGPNNGTALCVERSQHNIQFVFGPNTTANYIHQSVKFVMLSVQNSVCQPFRNRKKNISWQVFIQLLQVFMELLQLFLYTSRANPFSTRPAVTSSSLPNNSIPPPSAQIKCIEKLPINSS